MQYTTYKKKKKKKKREVELVMYFILAQKLQVKKQASPKII